MMDEIRMCGASRPAIRSASSATLKLSHPPWGPKSQHTVCPSERSRRAADATRDSDAILSRTRPGGFECGGLQKTHNERLVVSDMQPLGCYTAPSNGLSWPSDHRVCRLPR